jgi:hypothetical protein
VGIDARYISRCGATVVAVKTAEYSPRSGGFEPHGDLILCSTLGGHLAVCVHRLACSAWVLYEIVSAVLQVPAALWSRAPLHTHFPVSENYA